MCKIKSDPDHRKHHNMTDIYIFILTAMRFWIKSRVTISVKFGIFQSISTLPKYLIKKGTNALKESVCQACLSFNSEGDNFKTFTFKTILQLELMKCFKSATEKILQVQIFLPRYANLKYGGTSISAAH